jgi:hypothetical protein
VVVVVVAEAELLWVVEVYEVVCDSLELLE